jgi:hypothetical protein
MYSSSLIQELKSFMSQPFRGPERGKWNIAPIDTGMMKCRLNAGGEHK